MKRDWFSIAAIAVVVVLAVALYAAKSDAVATRKRIADLRATVSAEEDRVRALEAEAAVLESPQRIEALSDRFLELEVAGAGRIASPDELDAAAPLPPGPVP